MVVNECDGKPGLPALVWDTAILTPGISALRFSFKGQPGTAESDLVDLGEHEIVERAVFFEMVRSPILESLGLSPASSWCFINEKRPALLPNGPEGKPGDFDIIAGPVRDGLVHFDYLAEAEVKIRKVDSDGRPRSFASGMGTGQARGAAELGFDRTLLLHVLLQDGTGDLEGADWWRGTAGRAHFHETVSRTIGQVEKYLDLESAPFGYGLLGWGHASSVDPTMTGALIHVGHRVPPLLPLRDSPDTRENRARVVSGIKRRLGENRPAAPVFCACEGCGQVLVPSQSPVGRSCGGRG